MPLPARALMLVLCLGCFGVSAQTIYKSTMPDGKIVYGEKPAPGASRVDTVEPPPPKTGMTAITPQEKAKAEQMSKERAAAAGARQTDIEDARRQLQQAEAAREAGKEPLPGERLGTAAGGSRLTEAYFARQKSLELAVQSAKKRLDDLQGGTR